MPKIIYSEKEYDELKRYSNVMLHSLWDIESRYRDHFLEKPKLNKDYYTYIPLGLESYTNKLKIVLSILKERNPQEYQGNFVSDSILDEISFLEVGCGIGIKLLIARYYFIDSFGCVTGCYKGIEIDKESTEIARTLTPFEIYNIDALKFKDYDKFNIIYYYAPICDKVKEKKLERLIEQSVKPGTIIVTALKEDKSWEISSKFKSHGTGVIEKIA